MNTTSNSGNEAGNNKNQNQNPNQNQNRGNDDSRFTAETCKSFFCCEQTCKRQCQNDEDCDDIIADALGYKQRKRDNQNDNKAHLLHIQMNAHPATFPLK